jgi:hypothetical protein
MTEKKLELAISKRLRVKLLCQILLGGIFIYAGLGKILHPSSFAEIVENYRILPGILVNPVARILPWIEFIFGLLLVLGFSKRFSAGILSFLLLVFIAALGFNLIRGFNVNCGCLFQNQPADASSSTGMVISIIRDFLLLIPGIIIIFFTQRFPVHTPRE